MILRLGSAETMMKFAVMIAIITAKKKYRAFNNAFFYHDVNIYHKTFFL